MNSAGYRIPDYWFSLKFICALILVLAVGITWFAPKDDNSDAWAYHYYSGAMLLDGRLELDYFGASAQSFFNPLVHLPFAAMVKANWPDRLVATVMALYSGLALVLAAIFFRRRLNLQRWELFAALAMSLSCLIIWTCTGSSTPDLFLQIPVMLALLYLFDARVVNAPQRLFLPGFFLGVALGLKLSAIVYIPGFGILLLRWLIKREINLSALFWYGLGGLAGFLLVYGWWGISLYRHLENPFFPFFNQWFQSPHFAAESVANQRFISASLLEQALLPFRMSLADIFTYIELRSPDIRPGIFVLLLIALAIRGIWRKSAVRLNPNDMDFLIFLGISLYAWVFVSGNGRYAVGILVLLGAGILIGLRALLPFKWFRSSFLLVLLLQWFVIFQLLQFDSAAFRFRKSAWGGQWFNLDLGPVLGKENQLVLTGTRSSLAILVKDMGANSSVINVSGLYALENNMAIQQKIAQYEGNVLGMFMAGPDVVMGPEWVDRIYFEQFGRFGLRVQSYSLCRIVAKIDQGDKVGANFIFCPMVRDANVEKRYADLTANAEKYFQRVESICPDLFSPKKYAVTLSDKIMQKYYANYEIDMYIGKDQSVIAKKQWSMVMVNLGSMEDAFSLAPDVWKGKYCEPLRKSRAVSKE